ncbi:hypothetical protein QBC39DRAFT_142877 [Podospora conica]|nr:hypothetical protein QBC39DRAFT_142877 [Schizothecium conicum]
MPILDVFHLDSHPFRSSYLGIFQLPPLLLLQRPSSQIHLGPSPFSLCCLCLPQPDLREMNSGRPRSDPYPLAVHRPPSLIPDHPRSERAPRRPPGIPIHSRADIPDGLLRRLDTLHQIQESGPTEIIYISSDSEVSDSETDSDIELFGRANMHAQRNRVRPIEMISIFSDSDSELLGRADMHAQRNRVRSTDIVSISSDSEVSEADSDTELFARVNRHRQRNESDRIKSSEADSEPIIQQQPMKPCSKALALHVLGWCTLGFHYFGWKRVVLAAYDGIVYLLFGI